MNVAFKFESYRVLIVYNQNDLWDDIHLRLIDTDCTLFAVNSVKDALSLMSIMHFDIIIADADLPDSDGGMFLHSADLAHQDAVKIMHHQKANNGARWHLIVEGSDALDQKHLEIYGMLSILTEEFPAEYEKGGQKTGMVFEATRTGQSMVLQ